MVTVNKLETNNKKEIVMKKIFLSLAISGLVGTVVMAKDGPQIEAGPVKTLSEDAGTVAQLLLSPQLKACVAEIQNSKYDVMWDSVTIQRTSPRRSLYRISGMIMQGGDMVIGKATLAITETKEKDLLGFPDVRSYTCKVSQTR